MAKFSAGSTQPYFVLAGCGHISIRRMRPETAGIAFASDVVLHAPNGRPCPHCEGTEPATHTNDVDCSIDPDTDLCIVCGVDHSETCPECGRRGFHSTTCGLIDNGNTHSTARACDLCGAVTANPEATCCGSATCDKCKHNGCFCSSVETSEIG